MEGSGQLMLDSNVWLWAQGYGGLWRTENRGGSWKQVTKADSYTYDSIYKKTNGELYMPAAFGILKSTDGITWASVPNGPNATTISGSTTKIYVSRGICVGAGDNPKQTLSWASVDDTSTWTTIDGPPTAYGPDVMVYDNDHHILYASTCLGGFWRSVQD
jgi:hypothetical protein